MTDEAALAVRTWPVGERTCTLTVPRPIPGHAVQAVAEWSPDEPSRLTTDEWLQYRAGRNHAIAGIAAQLGINVAVLEL